MPPTSCRNSTPHTAAAFRRQAGILCFCLVVMILVWCLVLPVLSRHNGYGIRVQQLENAGIDPGAMFYTEHSRLLNPSRKRDVEKRLPENRIP